MLATVPGRPSQGELSPKAGLLPLALSFAAVEPRRVGGAMRRSVPKRSLSCGLMVVAGLAVTAGCGDPSGPAADYTISPNPTSASVAQGGNTTVQVTLARSGGFAGDVTLSLEAAPTGVAGTFSPMAAMGNTSTLTITVGSSVAAGTYPLTVKGTTSGVSDRTASFSLTVTVAPGYTIALNPTSASVAQGGNLAVQVTLTRTGGFTGAVALTLENAPAEVTGVFDPTPAPGESSILTVSVGGAATPGQYPLTVRGAWSGLADRTATLALTVTAPAGGSVTTVSAGPRSSCALNVSGQVYCWGGNDVGQLGDGTTTDRLAPTQVTGGLTFAALGTGGGPHTCGVTTSGAAYCWGFNFSGQLGDGTTTDRLVPTAVAGGLTFAALSEGRLHTCGVTTSGAAYCWGLNLNGELGDGTTTDRLVPTAVAGGLTFAALSEGANHTCGVTTSEAAYCWGNNSLGELGDGTLIDQSVPTPVAGGLTFATVSAGYNHTCGLTTSGAAYCWGWNFSGQLGDGTTTGPQLVPTPVAGDLTFAAVTAGTFYTCGLTPSGAAYCWGDNKSGELGDGTTTPRLVPTPVTGGLTFAVVSVGVGSSPDKHTCGVTTGGAAYCWGANHYGQVGDGTTANGRVVPTPVAFP